MPICPISLLYIFIQNSFHLIESLLNSVILIYLLTNKQTNGYEIIWVGNAAFCKLKSK